MLINNAGVYTAPNPVITGVGAQKSHHVPYESGHSEFKKQGMVNDQRRKLLLNMEGLRRRLGGQG